MHDTTFTDIERLDAHAPGAEAALEMDEEAFGAFYGRTSRALWGYLSRVTGDRQLADDLLQETYYRFLRSRRVHESEAHRRHYLFQIAVNLVRDRHRRRAVRPVTVTGPDAQLGDRADPHAPNQAELRADIDRAMRRLRPRDRTLLWLAYAEGSSHREIAHVLGVKSTSIRLMLFRARRRFAQVLGVGYRRGRDGGPRG